MILLSQLAIPRDNKDALIQLLEGDLTAIPTEHAADILVISAYPHSYGTEDRATLMSALFHKHIVVADMAKDKEIDLSEQLNCWLSRPLTEVQQAQFNFKRILCFEPPNESAKESVVANIFRCINTFAYDRQNNVIAMPVLASGNQRVPIEKMLPAILDAALFWLESGLPLDCIKLVLRNEEQVALALPIFIKAKQQYALKKAVERGNMPAAQGWELFELKNKTQSPGAATMVIVESEMKELADKESVEENNPLKPRRSIFKEKDETIKETVSPPAWSPPPAPQPVPAPEIHKPEKTEVPLPPASVAGNTNPATGAREFDFFISYSHKQTAEVKVFVEALLQKKPGLKIFYDRTTIPAGGLWIKLISDAIQHSKSVICILSPQYTASDVCWDEFQCAKAKEYRTKKQVIKTINFMNDANLPLMMSIYSYIDCTEGDIGKLKNCVGELLNGY